MSALADYEMMKKREARERLNAELRWEFACEFIEPRITEASNDPEAEFLLPNHEFLLRAWEPAIAVVKCRKTAHSWGIALKALARACTEPDSTTIIGSYDEDEAREKLKFLDWQWKVLPPAMRRELGMSDGMEVRKFNNGSFIRFVSRKAPTGAGASIEWDEFSVEKAGRVGATEILTAALAATTHTGQVSIGGTQRGPNTVFNQIVSGKRGGIWRVGRFPWWKSPALCNDPVAAVRIARHLPTWKRVERFGNDKLHRQYQLYLETPGQGLEMFQREFEMMVLDDKLSYFDLSLIQGSYPGDYEQYFFESCDVDGAHYVDAKPYSDRDILREARKKVDKLAELIRHRRLPPGEFAWSMDVGRDRDVDEIWIGQITNANREKVLPRINIGMSLMPFDGKEDIVHHIMKALPITRGLIDSTKGSLGRGLQDKMFRKYGYRCGPFEFSNSSKQIIVSGLRARMESDRITLPKKTADFEKLETQLLQFKKFISEAGNVIFDVERDKGHHGDCALSLCMLGHVFDLPRRVRPRRGVAAVRPSQTTHLPAPQNAALAIQRQPVHQPSAAPVPGVTPGVIVPSSDQRIAILDGLRNRLRF